MDAVERFSRKFGKWYEGLFGETSTDELKPKDVLRKILNAMEDNRSEGFDGKTYVPNKYVLELRVPDEDERDYLLSFLDEEELAAVLQRYMSQNGYLTRGPLDFTLKDAEGATASEKLVVKVRFEKGPKPKPDAAPISAVPAAIEPEEEDYPTVAGMADDLETVAAVHLAWAALAVTESDGRRSLITLNKPNFAIGRSRQAENDLVLAADGQCSKRHARIEREVDGQATLYDLGTTNGTHLNGKRVSGNASLTDGDEITIGQTKLVFQQEEAADSRAVSPAASWRKAYLISRADGSRFSLASETLIGRGVTCDVVLEDPEVGMRQAQIAGSVDQFYYLEDLSGKGNTKVNSRSIHRGERMRLSDGDVLQLGNTQLTFKMEFTDI